MRWVAIALVLLKILLSAQELMHSPYTPLGVLCRSRLFEREKIDDRLKSAFCRICNVSLTDDHWLQASLPLRNVGRGIRRVSSLQASSAFLASSAGTHRLRL